MTSQSTMLHCVAIALCLTVSGPLSISPAQAQTVTPEVLSRRLDLTIGKSRIIDYDFELGTMVVGDPGIADVVVMNAGRYYILGKTVGTTNIQVLDKAGYVVQVLDVIVSIDASEAARAITQALPSARINVVSSNNTLRLSGQVSGEAARSRALDIAASYTSGAVIDALVVDSPKQVFIKVQIIESTRQLGQNLGTNLASASLTLSGDWLTPGGVSTSSVSGTTIDALVTKGVARYLATPTLTAISGATASFLAGGEVPVVVASDGGSQVIYKTYGVTLEFTPYVQENGLIRLDLRPEVSVIDTSQGINPSFLTRRAQTTVELRDGESFVIAGLLQSEETRSVAGLPSLGELPVIGALFRNSTLKDNNTELLIVVTPTLTRPIPPNGSVNSPLENTQATQGADLFIDGRLERSTYGLVDLIRGTGVIGHYGPILSFGKPGAYVAK